MPRRRKPLAWLSTDLGAFPDCGPCADHLLSPMTAEAIASCAIENGSSVGGLTRRYIEHYHTSGHPGDAVIVPSKPSPWVRPGWFVAICVTDGLNQPVGWPDASKRAAWVAAHHRAFPDHEIHQAHGPAEVPA